MVLCDYISLFLWHLHCISFIHWHMELCRCLLAVTVPVQHCLLGITMRLHTLLGMKAGDTAFALHMHYNFGLWHDGLGLRLWMSCKKLCFSKVWWLLIFTMYGVVSIVGHISLLIVGLHIIEV